MKTFTSKNFTTMGIITSDDRKIIAIDNGSSTISFTFKSDKQIDKIIKELSKIKTS